MVNLGDVFPNFKADTTEGPIEFHEWLGDSYVNYSILNIVKIEYTETKSKV